MKKVIFLLTLIATLALGFSSCSKDDDKEFKYPMEMLYGTWEGTAVKIDGMWIDITSPIYYDIWFAVKFNPNGTYTGSGIFGVERGTYRLEKEMIYTYLYQKEYARYRVVSMTDTMMELIMIVNGMELDLLLKKNK